jgi:hypothetical protein
LLERFFEKIRANGFQVVAEGVEEAEVLLVSKILAAFKQQTSGTSSAPGHLSGAPRLEADFPTRSGTSLTHRFLRRGKNLKLRRVLEIYEEQLRAADKGDISSTRTPAAWMISPRFPPIANHARLRRG